MNSISDIDQSRRQFLLYLLTTGTLASLAGCETPPSRLSEFPEELPPGRSIYEFDGDVRVNNLPVSLKTPIRPGDLVETAANSYVIFVVNKDAFILRSEGRMEFPMPAPPTPAAPPVSAFNLSRGKALSVLATRATQITTPNAVIGIRGTGVYLETDPERSYVCTCYGVADLATADDPGINETIESRHHDDPRYILSDPGSSNRIQPAPFINHDDQELLLIETLVGRSPPYPVPRSVTRTRALYR
ncbi:MAG: hypothetical protein O2780_13590 [Proteobacteria bacterium]|nr:hypothetical protein [Pseudomonadota bacterium]MDA1299055.1 hypothetical protein [Pseudomonadota bacterium]